jgi:hypothetical protein
MNDIEIESILADAEAEQAAGGAPDLRRFWRAVSAVKLDPALVDRFADRIAAVDSAAFAQWAPIRVPLWAGTALMSLGTVAGLALVAATYFLDDPWNGFALVVGTVVLVVTVHGLTHLVVGAIVGIRFTAWFATVRRPQPGLKTDYSSYLLTPAKRRAWMHASGAIATKVVPFVVLPVGPIAGAPWWATAAVLLLGIGQVTTDLLWSVKASDWKKFRREMAIARAGVGET